MATIHSQDSFLDNFLTCKMCMSLFDDEKHVPKLLNCMHTFCEQCLQNLMTQKSRVLCSFCKTAGTVTPESLPNNPLVTNYLAKMKERSDFKHRPNVPCDNCLNEAVAYCQDWDMNVCKSCIDRHTLVNICKLQQVAIPHNEFNKGINRGSKKSAKCQHHSDKLKVLNMFRSIRKKKTCQKCRRASRSRFNSTTSQITAEKGTGNACKNKLMELLLEECQERSRSVQTLLPSINNSICQVETDRREKVDKIDEVFRSLVDKLEEQRQVARQEACRLSELKKKVLNDQKDEMEGFYAQCEGVSEFAKQLSKYSDPAQHLDLQQQVRYTRK